MNAILFLLPIAIGLGGTFLVLFLRAAARGEFDDLEDPPVRILQDD